MCVFLQKHIVLISSSHFSCGNFRIVKAAMQERLRKKAELQAKARKPMGYAESMEAERKKQKSLEKTKEERRQALCEELGRGC
jgi:hypothetical protein